MSETQQHPEQGDDYPTQADEFLRIARQQQPKRPSEPAPNRD